MPDDRSLDEFAVGGGSGEGPDAGPESDPADADPQPTAASADDSGAVEPAVSASTWHADGAACDRCDARVDRRWRDGDAFVCADCASW